MLRSNPRAAVVFYGQIHRFVPLLPICKLTAGLFKHLAQSASEKSQSDEPQKERLSLESNAEASQVDDSRESQSPNKLLNAQEQLIVLQIIATLYQRVLPLCTNENSQLREKLLQIISVESLMGISRNITHHGFNAMPYMFGIMALLPKSDNLAKELRERLKMLEPDVKKTEYEPIVRCLFSWGYSSKVLKLISSSLIPLQNSELIESISKKRRTNSESETPEPDLDKAALSLKLLELIFSDESMRDATFEDVDSMLAITTPIKAIAFQLQSRAEIDMESCVFDHILLSAFEIYSKLFVHQFTRSQLEEKSVVHILQLGNFLVQKLSESEGSKNIEDTPGKRAAVSFLELAVELLCVIIADLVVIGIASSQSKDLVASYLNSLFEVKIERTVIHSLPSFTRIVYHWLHKGEEFESYALSAITSAITKLAPSCLHELSLGDPFSLLVSRSTQSVVCVPFLEFLFAELESLVPDAVKAQREMLDLAIQIPLVCDVEAMTPSSKYVLSALVSSAGMLSSTAIELKERVSHPNPVSLWKILSVVSLLFATIGKTNVARDTLPLQDCLTCIISTNNDSTDGYEGAFRDCANNLLTKLLE